MSVVLLDIPAAGAAISEDHSPPAFEPYIPAATTMRELTVLPVVVGAVLGMIFGASSLYLVLKVGLTVSASIPVAVISITLFRLLSKVGGRDATILEHNIVQTAGSAGESIAFGLGVTMPAIMILGFDLEITRVMLVAVLGGLLGILMMIPLRRALIVQQHGILKYPEGTACAEVLKAGASAESQAAASPSAKREQALLGGAATSAATIFTGFGVGLAYKALNVAFKGWKDVPQKIFGPPFAAGSVSAEISPELLGVGYIIGPRIASIMCAGGVLAYLVLIPAIKFFGSGLTAAARAGHHADRRRCRPTTSGVPTSSTSAQAPWRPAASSACCVRCRPSGAACCEGLKDLRGGERGRAARVRTDQDLSMKVVLFGSIALVIAIMLARPLHMNLVGASLIVVLGFLFVTVSSRLTGEVGSSSNPISGMTVATLLLTCLVFLMLGWTGPSYYVTALSVGAIVCIASSNGGTTSQDLKTGFLVGATPRNQQIAIVIGALLSAVLLGPVLLQLNRGRDGLRAAHQQGAGRWRRRSRAARRREFSRDAASRSRDADRQEDLRRAGVPRLAQAIARRRSGRPVSGRRERNACLPRRPRHQRHASLDSGRAAPGGEIRRPEGDVDVVHHQGHPQPSAALGAGAPRRHDRAGARDVRASTRSRSPWACICRCRRRARSSSAAWCAGWAICMCGRSVRARVERKNS